MQCRASWLSDTAEAAFRMPSLSMDRSGIPGMMFYINPEGELCAISPGLRPVMRRHLARHAHGRLVARARHEWRSNGGSACEDAG